MMNHVDNRCKNLLDDNDYHTVMTQIKMVSYAYQQIGSTEEIFFCLW